MNETQTDYDTNAGPTPGPWRLPYSGDPLILQDNGVVLAESKGHKEPYMVAEVNQAFNEDTNLPGDWEANARLIAAAGTAAQEARESEMGIDPIKMIQAALGMALALDRITYALLNGTDITQGDDEEYLQKLREKINALASAEGSGDE